MKTVSLMSIIVYILISLVAGEELQQQSHLSQEPRTQDVSSAPDAIGAQRNSNITTQVATSDQEGDKPRAYCYPVVANFESWKFPIDRPPQWRSSPPFYQPESQCQLTGDSLPLEECHIVPRAHKAWFQANEMTTHYATAASSKGRLDRTNVIYLRVDLQRLWDSKFFTFLPKTVREDEKVSTQILLYCIQDTPEIVQKYHHMPLLDQAVPREFLLARYAWSLLPSALEQFFSGIRKRRAYVLQGSEEGFERVTKELSGREWKAIAHSSNTKKRKLDEANDASEGFIYNSDSESSGTDPRDEDEDHEGFLYNSDSESSGTQQCQLGHPRAPERTIDHIQHV